MRYYANSLKMEKTIRLQDKAEVDEVIVLVSRLLKWGKRRLNPPLYLDHEGNQVLLAFSRRLAYPRHHQNAFGE